MLFQQNLLRLKHVIRVLQIAAFQYRRHDCQTFAC